MPDKRRARVGQKGGNLTPEEAKRKLAIPVYAMLVGDAVPIFPGTSLAAPSALVGIFIKPGKKCRGLSKGATAIFPVWINDKQYETAVVPVLVDSQDNAQSAVFQALSSSNLSYLIEALGNALAQSFHDAGYGPLPV